MAALSVKANIWKQPKCPSVGECIKKVPYVCAPMCVCLCIYIYIYIYIYMFNLNYSVIKCLEILPFATTWVDLEDIMISKRRQASAI